ncbi:hypothetical protein DFS34DRAFT_591084 [Phlyctochytrium arcticum]|nr:hypothetical protein DFS34DRAFT_591084 [Phlyctochytrium arcticum]
MNPTIPFNDFNKYIKKAEDKKMFASWWSSEDTKAMLKMAMSDEWADINYVVEKSDVTKHYGYLSLEHMNLRGLAETIEVSMFGNFGYTCLIRTPPVNEDPV